MQNVDADGLLSLVLGEGHNDHEKCREDDGKDEDGDDCDDEPNKYPMGSASVICHKSKTHCGAIVIADNAIMTSASCVDGKNNKDLEIGGGSPNIIKQKKCKKIIEKLIHPSYKVNSCRNNLAVIICETSVFAGPNYKKVTLPLEPTKEIGSEPGYSVGLGKPEGFDLRTYKVSLMTNEKCHKDHGKATLCCSKDCDYVGDPGHGLSINGIIYAIRCESAKDLPVFTALYDKKNLNFFSVSIVYANTLLKNEDKEKPGLININIGK